MGRVMQGGERSPAAAQIRQVLTAATKACATLVGFDKEGRPRIKVTDREVWDLLDTPHGKVPVPSTQKWPSAAVTLQVRWPEVEALPQVSELRQLVAPYELTLLPYMSERGSTGLIDRWFVIEAISRVLNSAWSGQDLSDAAAEQAELVYIAITRNVQDVSTKALVWNFDISGLDEVDLGSGIHLRRLTIPDRQRRFLPNPFRPVEERMHFERVAWVIETTVKYRPGDAEYRLPPRDVFDTVVALLRLIKPGPIGYQWVDATYGYWQRSQDVRILVRSHLFIPQDTVVLDPADVERLKEMWRTVSLRDKKPRKASRSPLRVAISRLLDAEAQTFPEDALIDSVICLEALLLANAKEEIRYRFGQRGSVIMAGHGPKAREMRIKLMKAYDARSALVHGGEYSRAKVSSDEVIQWAWKTLRRVIAYLAHMNHDGVIRAVDDYLVEAERKESLDEYLQYQSRASPL